MIPHSKRLFAVKISLVNTSLHAISDQTPSLWLIDVRERAEVAREGKIPNSVNLPLCELKKALLSDCEDFDLTYGFSKPEKHHENIIFYREERARGSF